MLIGHEDIKERLSIAIKSSNVRNTSLAHMLLTGMPGCGKTTTAKWVASLGDFDFVEVAPINLKRKKDVLKLFENMNLNGYNLTGDRVSKIKPTVLFFDEIHQMPVVGQEILGMAMEYFELESEQPNKKVWLPYFTVIGATTEEGKLTKPFRSRFQMTFLYTEYGLKELYDILLYHSYGFKLYIEEEAGKSIVTKSRGVPRILLNYLSNIRDYVYTYFAPNSQGLYVITEEITSVVFNMLNIDRLGLTSVDVKILQLLYTNKEPMGIDNLAISTGESLKTIQFSIEPYLIKSGLIIRLSKGRKLTDFGARYLEEEGYVSTMLEGKQLIDNSYKRV